MAERAGFERAVSGADSVIDDPEVDAVVIATPHDTHAALAARALRAGKHVFCEKPLALTVNELDDVEEAWNDHGCVLFVGFNRRWSDPVRLVREQLRSRPGPLVITYRVSAGDLPASHWYHDRTQGGRLLGEVCHFVDTCAAIVGGPAVEAQAMGGGCAERLLTHDLVVSLRYPDGSLASVTYASNGHPQTEKESIEILGRGHTAKISNFETVIVDGQKRHSGNIDKGHLQLCAAFWRAVVGVEEDQGPADAFASTRSTLLAASSLTGPAQSSVSGGGPDADPDD
jgi:predicted dehydrogenase